MSVPTVIRVGQKTRAFTELATFFDGEKALPQSVALTIDEAAGVLRIHADHGPVEWVLSDIRELRDQAGRDQWVYRLKHDRVARLIMRDESLKPRCPNLHHRVGDVPRLKLVGWAVAAVASVALIISVLVPTLADQLAEYIPPEGERALGEVTLSQVREVLADNETGQLAFCERESGLRALMKIEDTLVAQANLQLPLTIQVLDHDMINAFALPGGFVILFRGLIDAAETPEQLAAVVAHEMGHVATRDPTRHALRSAGSLGVLGLLFGDFAGGAAVLFLTERLIAAQYSQAAETGADAYAYEIMKPAGISPAAMGEMFGHLLEEYGETEDVVSHFLSHPKLSERIDAAHAAVPKDFSERQLLSAEEWQALKGICRG